MYPYVVADIGGTNARFATITAKDANGFKIENIQKYKGKEFPKFEQALAAYFDSLGTLSPKYLCAAVAGPIVGKKIQMTNIDWLIDCESLEQQFKLEKFIPMNDYGALAVACSHLSPDDLTRIKPGSNDPQGNKAVFGPGTGLGVAGVVYHNGNYIPVACEGGHVNIAPTDALEAEVIKAGIAQLGHVSAENFISGPGLINLYHALASATETKANKLGSAEISRLGTTKEDDLCFQTMKLFCSFAGSFAGNLALTYNATGGVYITGGIFPRFIEFLKESDFNAKFAAKGAMEKVVAPIPVDLIIHPEVAFVGAAAWLESQLI